jgi:tryptophan 2,3-dioxygenase
MADDDPTFPPDPPHGGPTYVGYLQLQPLLTLQRPLSQPEHHDELLFIVIHQIYELWFKQILHELDAAVAAFDHDAVLRTHKIFRRVSEIQRVLIQQLAVLESMTPQDFNVFRNLLNPASGFQSLQFREIEAVSGAKDPRYLKLHKDDPVGSAQLRARLEGRTVYDAFCGYLGRRGFQVDRLAPEPESDASRRLIDALYAIYMESDRHYDLYLTSEHLVTYDELFAIWRFGHVKMVERTIGERMGTGGSPGARYLRATTGRRFFPELWDVRNRLGGAGSWGE